MHYTLWPLGDQALLLRLRDSIGMAEQRATQRAFEVLTAARLPGVRSVTASYSALCIELDLMRADVKGIEAAIAGLIDPLPEEQPETPRGALIEVPTRYRGDDGPDLSVVAQLTGLSVAQVIDCHTSAEYTVAMIGFLPGFPYLLGLPEALHVPRLETPRPAAAGSVAIAGAQAGIYPQASPGGWRVLGRTEMRLFDASAVAPLRLNVGDRVRFVPL